MTTIKNVAFTLAIITSYTSIACEYDANIIPTAPASRFILNDDGTAVDKQTGLMWSRCTVGMQWDAVEKTCVDEFNNWYTWDLAISEAEQSTFAHFNDWRVPNIKELASIIESACSRPALNADVFVNIHQNALIHSSTPAQKYQEQAWYINHLGNVSAFKKDDEKRVLLVRDQFID